MYVTHSFSASGIAKVNFCDKQSMLMATCAQPPSSPLPSPHHCPLPSPLLLHNFLGVINNPNKAWNLSMLWVASKSPTQNCGFVERTLSLWLLCSGSARRRERVRQGQQPWILYCTVTMPALSTDPGKDSLSTQAITTAQWAGVSTWTWRNATPERPANAPSTHSSPLQVKTQQEKSYSHSSRVSHTGDLVLSPYAWTGWGMRHCP